jgi:uncharacterized membrane protein (UPF0127 family)
MMRRAVILSLFFFAACSSSPPALNAADAGSDVVRVPVTVQAANGDVIFQSEICDDDEERSRGMMHRKSIGEREGMIFLFPRETQLSFWMRNTLIPLDIIFIRADHTILGVVENAVPQTDTPRFIRGNSQFVLEIAGGAAAKLGIQAGQTVDFYAPLPPN